METIDGKTQEHEGTFFKNGSTSQSTTTIIIF